MKLLRMPAICAWTLAAACLVAAAPLRAGERTPPAPLTHAADDDDPRFEFAYESAVTFDLNNPNHYVTNPHLVLVRWQPYHTEQFFHTDFTFTRQFEVNAMAIPFWHGPEQHYFGGGVGVRLIYGKTGSKFSLYLQGRLDVGAIDSSGPPHGEGQDLTFCPQGAIGVTYRASKYQKVSLGVIYVHFSNAGLSEPERPNIGINTLGPMVEWSLGF